MSKEKIDAKKLAICICNDDYQVSLERRKIYDLIPDPEAERHHQLRIIDESGEDYLYPAHYFVAINLPKEIEKVVKEIN